MTNPLKWLVIAVCIAIIVAVVIVTFQAPEEGSIADKYIIPHMKEQVSIQEEEITVIHRQKGEEGISVIHDDKRNVTCWAKGEKGGMSCIPDHMLSP